MISREFIHEELFLLEERPDKDVQNKSSKSSASNENQSAYSIGVIGSINSEEEKVLILKVVEAIQVEESTVLYAEEINDQVATWLVFENRLLWKNQELLPTKRYLIENHTIILAHPLSILRGSIEAKKALWQILKGEFSI